MQKDSGELALGLWITVSELARRKGVNKSAVSRRVKLLQEDGLITVRTGERGTKLINIAEYDRATGARGDGARTTGAEPGGLTFRQAQTREKQYAAELRKLDLMEKLGHVVPVTDLEKVIAEAATIIVAVLERLPNEAERIRAAGEKDSTNGIRTELKKIVHAQRQQIADALRRPAETFKPTAPLPADETPIGATAPSQTPQDSN
jgi:DNA-binding transcriptional ArsR family regulator